MTATAIELNPERASLSVCLFENPYRLVSLWDMLRFLAGDFCRASGIIGQVHSQVRYGIVPTDNSWGIVGGEIGSLERLCESLGLSSTLAQIRRIKSVHLGKPEAGMVHVGEMARDVMEVHTRLVDELQARLILLLPPEKAAFYSETGISLFGSQCESAFPSASYDTLEAGKCHALQRSTACVFHLMRVLEIGLSVLAARFGVPSDHTNWHNIIEGVEKVIRNMPSDHNRPSDWKDQQEFYSQAASSFMFLKDAWRNYTAHARGKYTEDEAYTLFINVRAFMQKLSTRLRE